MAPGEVRIPIGEAAVTASVHGSGSTVVVLGHGAGSDRRSPGLLGWAEAVAASGRVALLYNFPYRERGGRAPDPAPLLETTTRAVGDYARATLGAARLVHGGRSMGGRIASQAVAAGAPADGLIFLSYPLHPPGQPQRLRDRHLPQISVPMLFVQGTRDPFARWDLLEATLAHLGSRATLHRVEDGDHSLAVRKRSGQTGGEVRAAMQAAVVAWLGAQGL